ncbi:MAG: TetR/AcrR family transcriptional regulator [Corynebacterium sp.]|nr:TetR/AcrR family transcriptional regulator [Corynebacterium sp.]
MPRISEPTIAEHRERITNSLIDAAEGLLKRGAPLTAGAVTTEVGIARNSIYRYVASINDLRAMVVARYLPTWLEQLSAALADVPDPAERIVTWVTTNFSIARSGGHAFLMQVGRGRSAPESPEKKISENAHRQVAEPLEKAWSEVLSNPNQARRWALLTVSILEMGFYMLEVDADPATLERDLRAATIGLIEQATRR